MPSMKNIVLGAAALAGMATAFPQTAPYSNGTVAGGVRTNGTSGGSAGGISVPTNNTSDNGAFCPTLNGKVYIDGLSVAFLIECETSHFGTIIDISINATLAKRQAAVAPANLGDCLDLCAANSICVGTAFNEALQTCALYSDVGVAFEAPTVSFGIIVARDAEAGNGASTVAAGNGASTVAVGNAASTMAAGNGATTISAGGVATSTIYSTNVATIYSCAPTVTNCPLTAGAAGGSAVVTQVIPVSTTTYICPSATVIPATPIACGCAYGASTVGAYSKTVISGSTVIKQVTSTVIAVPSPSATEMSATTCPASAMSTYPAVSTQVAVAVCNGASCPATTMTATTMGATASSGMACSSCKASGTPTSGMAMFTGAASQMKAGAGVGAIVAAAALLL